MYNRYLCVRAGEVIADSSGGNESLIAALGEFAEVCGSEGRAAVTVSEKGGARQFRAGDYCGFICFADGTLLEILPADEKDDAEAKKKLCGEFCRRCGYPFPTSSYDPDTGFMEFFISVFAEETMKIIKSGVLSAYTSREENMTTVHGAIMFAENNRRNLVHRERVYVRHDVFTPDRAENRIIKAGAGKLIKLTASSRSSHLLMESLSFLDEVQLSRDIPAEFSKCINTRNTKKYSTILSICRMLFCAGEGTAFRGKYVLCAQLYRMQPEK